MTLEEFFRLGCEMRTAQKEYFRIRTSSSLKRAKALERRFDDAIDELRRPKNQTSLELDFGPSGQSADLRPDTPRADGK